MDTIDNKIRSALNTEDAKLLGDPGEGQRLDQLVVSAFRARNNAMTILFVGMTFVIMAIAAWCAVRFFGSGQTKHQIAWSVGFLVCMMAISLFKLWFWMEMQRIGVTREVKRVELLVARLIQREDGRVIGRED